MQIFRKKLATRGVSGVVGMQRSFKIMDKNNSNSLDMQEFSTACKEYKVEIPLDDIKTLFRAYDRNKDGTIDYNEFVRLIKVT